MSEFVFILTNPSIPDVIKIGTTSSLNRLFDSLNNSNIPTPFKCYFVCMVEDMEFTVQKIYDGFSDYRINTKEDLFKIDPERVVSILQLVMIDEVIPDRIIYRQSISKSIKEKWIKFKYFITDF
jgi:hypothetical protein